jgi:di/tricarboxylate transporter
MSLDLLINRKQNKKMPRRHLILIAVLLCFVGLYGLEAAHHHVKEADEMACAVCHVAAHSAAEATAPLVMPAFSMVLLFLAAIPAFAAFFSFNSLLPRSRSPPASS